MFWKIKYIVFKIKILTVLLLSRSFGNVIYDIAASSNGLLSTTDIRSLEKCYKKREKAGLDITFLKNCRTFNVFSSICYNFPFVFQNKNEQNYQNDFVFPNDILLSFHLRSRLGRKTSRFWVTARFPTLPQNAKSRFSENLRTSKGVFRSLQIKQEMCTVS